MPTKKISNYKRDAILYILLIGIVSFTYAFANYSGTIYAKRQYMPLIYSMQDDSYLSNDFYVQETKGFNVRFFFSLTVVFLNKLFDNFDITFPFISSITIFLISLNIYLLTNFYFKDKKFGVLISVISIFLIHFNLGGIDLISPYIKPNMISYIFILSALNLIVRKNNIFGYFTLGLAVIFEPIEGLLMYITFIFVQIAPYILKLDIKIALTAILKSLSFFISSSVNLIPLYILNTQTALPEQTELVSYMMGVFKHWSHISPFLWPIQKYILFGIFLIIVLILSHRFVKQPEHRIYLHSYLFITGLLLLVGTIFVEIWPIAVIVKATIFRVLVFFTAVSYIFVIRYLYLSALKSRLLAEKIIIMIIPIFFFSPVTIKIGLLSLSVWMIFEKYKHKLDIFRKFGGLFNNRNYNLLYLISFGIIFSIVVWLWRIKGAFSGLGLPSFTLRLLILIYFVFVYLYLFWYLMGTKKNYWLVLQVPVIITLIILPVIFSMRDISEEKHCGLYYAPAQYVKHNTDKSSLFLVPPGELTEFRLCANRALVVDSTSVFTDKSIVKWHNRLLDITKQKEFSGPRNNIQLDMQYNTLTDEDIRMLQSKYKFDYALFEKKFLNQKHYLPILYQDVNFIIYSVAKS